MLILDSCILIDHFAKKPRAVAYVHALLDRQIAAIHPVSIGEILSGAQSGRAIRIMRQELQVFRIATVKSSDLKTYVDMLVEYKPICGIDWPDCLIAATAIRVQVPLVTVNDKHFRPIRGLSVIRPY